MDKLIYLQLTDTLSVWLKKCHFCHMLINDYPNTVIEIQSHRDLFESHFIYILNNQKFHDLLKFVFDRIIGVRGLFMW